jgi:helix-turn-helix protein
VSKSRPWSAVTQLLREHRGDGHNAALVAHGIGGTEAHVLLALSLGMREVEILHGDAGEHVVAVDLACRTWTCTSSGVSSPRGTKVRTLSSAPTSARVADADSTCSTRTLGQLATTPRAAAQAVCTGPVDTPAHA